MRLFQLKTSAFFRQMIKDCAQLISNADGLISNNHYLISDNHVETSNTHCLISDNAVETSNNHYLMSDNHYRMPDNHYLTSFYGKMILFFFNLLADTKKLITVFHQSLFGFCKGLWCFSTESRSGGSASTKVN